MIASIRRILFPTDFSEPAKKAQEYAMALADRFGADLHLLNVIPPLTPPSDSPTPWVNSADDIRWQVETAELRLARELDSEWTKDHTAKYCAVMGSEVHEIMRYANENEIDLIVIGTHGRTGLSHMLIGSVAEKLVRVATCPVLTVHPKGHQFLIDEHGDW